MATRTFVGDGASHNWSATTAWAEGIVPTAADNVVFSTNTAGSVLVIDGTSGTPSLCRSFDTTNYTKTITFGSGAQLNIGDGTAGAFKLTAGLTFAPNAASTLKFVSTTTGNNITWGGYTLGNITFDGVGGAWQFQDAIAAAGTSSSLSLTNGSLDTNGKSISFNNLSSSNSNTRSLTLGATNFTLGTTSTQGVWDIGTSTGMTLSAASSTITFGNTTGGGTFGGGGLTYGTLTSTTLTTGVWNITGANTFGAATLSIAATAKIIASGYKFSANQTVTGNFTANGNTALLRNFLYSDTLGTARTITCNGTVTVTHTDFRDIVGAGSGSWDFSALTTTQNGNGGGNSGITFVAPKNCYMKVGASANWSAGNWFTASGGSTPIVPALPMVHDTAIFDASSITAGSVTITVDEVRLPAMDWTGVTNTPAFANAAIIPELYGGMILVSGMTHTGSGVWSFVGRGSFNFDGGGLTWPSSSTITINCVNGVGTYTLTSNFTSNSSMTVTSGTLTGAKTLSCTTLSVNGGTFTVGGNITLTGNCTVSSGTLTGGGFTISGGTTGTFSGGTTTNISWSGTVPTVSNGTHTFNTLTTTTSTFSGGTCTVTTHTASGLPTVSGGNYNPQNLTVTGAGLTITSGTCTPSGATVIAGALTVSNPGILHAAGQTITGISNLTLSTSDTTCTIGTMTFSGTCTVTNGTWVVGTITSGVNLTLTTGTTTLTTAATLSGTLSYAAAASMNYGSAGNNGGRWAAGVLTVVPGLMRNSCMGGGLR